MPRILLACATLEGQSRKTADALADEARAFGHAIEMPDLNLPHDDLDLSPCVGFIVGGSVHALHHEPALVHLVVRHLADLGA